MVRRGSGRRCGPVHGFDAHQGEGEKAQEEAGDREQTPKACLDELDEQVDQDREVLGKKPFVRDDGHKGGGSSGTADTTTKMQSTTDPDSGQQSREVKPDGFPLQRASHGEQHMQRHRKCPRGTREHQRHDPDARDPG